MYQVDWMSSDPFSTLITGISVHLGIEKEDSNIAWMVVGEPLSL